LQRNQVIAIVPRPSTLDRQTEQVPQAVPVLDQWVRIALLAIALALVAVFGVAFWLNPYDERGNARRSETHLQMGLPPCTFRIMTGIPCPSCGMTTSFALLVRGDIENSARANVVGTLLALFCLAFIPWSLACVAFRRTFLVSSFERPVLWLVIIFVVLLMTRWLIVLGWGWWSGTQV
jgi:hypothetical protein